MPITIAQEGSVAVITLNRPERRNALSLDLMHELIAALDRLGSGREVRAVILAAAGKVFCSGHDLSEMTGRDINEYRKIFDVCSELMLKIQAIPQPVIAEVQGVATAAGCQLVAACDLAIAAEDAWFATPGVKIGLFCTTPMVALTRAIGRKRAFQMLLTGDPVDARTAAEWGLINDVVAAAELPGTTRKLAKKGRRLVEEQELGRIDYVFRERHAGLLSGRELAGRPVEQLGQVERLAQLLDAVGKTGHAIEHAEDGEVLPHREPHRHFHIRARSSCGAIPGNAAAAFPPRAR